MAAKETAIWDPIWEYVLNDYDVKEEPVTRSRSSRSNKSRSSRSPTKRRSSKSPTKRDRKTETQRQQELSKQEELEQQRSLLDFFSEDSRTDQESPRNETSVRKRGSVKKSNKKEKPENIDEPPLTSSWSWSRQDLSEGREESDSASRRHPWRRNKPMEEVGVEEPSTPIGSLWDIVNPPDLNTGASKNDSSRSLQQSGSFKSKGKGSSFRSVKEQEESVAPTEKTESKSDVKSSKRKGFFTRNFRKQGSDAPLESNYSDDHEADSSGHTDEESKYIVAPANSRQIKTLKLKEKPRRENEDDFNPLSMFLEVAEKLDPWGSGSESDSTSPSAAPSDRTDDVTDDGARWEEGEVAPIRQDFPEPSNFTEVRLRHTPIREKRDEEEAAAPEEASLAGAIFEAKKIETAAFESRRVYKTGGSRILARLNGGLSADESSVAHGRDRSVNHRGRSFMPISLQRSRGSVASVASKKEDGISDEHQEQNSSDVPHAYSSDLFFKAPSELEPVALESSHVIETRPEESPRPVWKKVVCCSIKNKKMDPTSLLLNGHEMKDVLPRTRMVSDEPTERAAVVARANESTESDVMGLPDSTFLEKKGPQSFYNYDYGLNQHMDVQYEKFSFHPKSSLITRRLDMDPNLLGATAGDKLVVQVEASTVSETDCAIRRGEWWRDEPVPLPNSPGVEIVGKILHIHQGAMAKYDLKPAQTVISLTKWGGNTRFMTIDPNQVVKVPENVDPAQAVTLPETYLTAFQALHFGQLGPIRYRENALRGKSLIILGAMANNMGRALIELALNAGAANIYATAKKKHWQKLISFGVMPLTQEPKEWILRLEGTVDLVLATNGGIREDVTPIHFRALRDTGHLILCGKRTVGNDIPVGEWKQQQTQLLCAKNRSFMKMMNRTHAYDVFEQWEKDLETCKRDLAHLLKLLERGVLKPNILDRIALTKVSKAHELLESKRLSGFLVCEPWLRSKKRAVYL